MSHSNSVRIASTSEAEIKRDIEINDAVMTIGTMIQTFLPVLTELAKGGAKFEIEELENVRESVKVNFRPDFL